MASHKILVIDDSKVIRMRVRDMLPKGNFEVLEAKDGVEGLNLIRQEHPNLIMLDFLLPKMSGWEVFQHIQSDATLQSIPLVLMSGRKEEVTEKLQEPFEFFEFIEKPFENKELIDAIKSAMAKARLHRTGKAAAPAAAAAAPAAPAAAAAAGGGADAAEVKALKEQVARMQAEINALKKQTAQILAFIKQKLK